MVTHELEPDEPDNRGNGKAIKNVKSKYGAFELATPKDRNGSFDPN